ncbi:MAG: 1-acyl-sn-glycerol-3-phosphate acyltransferase [Pseudomonadota bacterium]
MSMLTLPITWFARLTLALLGWKLLEIPAERPRTYVAIMGHHTSHWDVAIGLLGYWALRVPFRVLVKKEMIDAPVLGPLVRALGGIPVDRANPGSLVNHCVNALHSGEMEALVLAPSGTRSHRPGWKMGFYAMARRAKVPLMLNYLDYEKREVGLGEPIWLSGDVDRDMARIRCFYAQQTPKFPERFTPIRPLATSFDTQPAAQDEQDVTAGTVPAL